jgi:Na+(H+)/acetate symporter ActP
MHDWYIFYAWLMHLFMIQVDYRLFGQVIVTDYLYRFGQWLMNLFMVQVEVQVNVWYMLAQFIGIG